MINGETPETSPKRGQPAIPWYLPAAPLTRVTHPLLHSWEVRPWESELKTSSWSQDGGKGRSGPRIDVMADFGKEVALVEECETDSAHCYFIGNDHSKCLLDFLASEQRQTKRFFVALPDLCFWKPLILSLLYPLIPTSGKRFSQRFAVGARLHFFGGSSEAATASFSRIFGRPGVQSCNTLMTKPLEVWCSAVVVKRGW